MPVTGSVDKSDVIILLSNIFAAHVCACVVRYGVSTSSRTTNVVAPLCRNHHRACSQITVRSTPTSHSTVLVEWPLSGEAD